MKVMFHPFHIVTLSPWPLYAGTGSMFMLLGILRIVFLCRFDLFYFSLLFLIVVVIVWWRDVIRESTFEGRHLNVVVFGLIVGIVLFIVSELLFFVSFFWAFFHSRLVPVVELGGRWPPCGIKAFNPFQVPLLNTVILLSSGVRVTWAHQGLLVGKNYEVWKSLFVTWFLGMYFLLLQLYEYINSSFRIRDSVFGSVFFVATGFHGFHVIVGSLFLIVMWVRVWLGHFSEFHHFGFEASAWYWHFVDVIWLFLFSVVYWWGG